MGEKKKLNIKQQPANKLAPLLLSTFVIKAEESNRLLVGHSYAYFIYSHRALKAVLYADDEKCENSGWRRRAAGLKIPTDAAAGHT